MMSFVKYSVRRVRRFLKDQTGVASVESILLIPLLFWAYIGTFVMFDAYKKQTDGLRVSYAVADAISREENEINQAYLNSMVKLSNYMTRVPSKITQRVTIVCYSPKKKKYRVAWSRSTGPLKQVIKKHTNGTIHNYKDRLPEMPLGDQVILVETFMDYAPLWDVGVSSMTFDYWIFTRPRFTNQVKWAGKPNWVCPSE